MSAEMEAALASAKAAEVGIAVTLNEIHLRMPRLAVLERSSRVLLAIACALVLPSPIYAALGVFWSGIGAIGVVLQATMLGTALSLGALLVYCLSRRLNREAILTPTALIGPRYRIALEDIEALSVRRGLFFSSLQAHTEKGRVPLSLRTGGTAPLAAVERLVMAQRAQRRASLTAAGHDLAASIHPPAALQKLRER